MIKRSRILIADDNSLMAELCLRQLNNEFDVVGIVGDGRTLLSAACELKPHVILLEVALPILNGLDAGQQVKAILPSARLLYLTMNADCNVAVQAFARGASGYLLKTCAAAELVFAISEVMLGNTYLSQAFSRDTFNSLRWENGGAVKESDPLTHRQREVLQLLAEGKVMKEVGSILDMTTRTVAFHKYRIMETIDARTNAELVRYAVRTHLVKT